MVNQLVGELTTTTSSHFDEYHSNVIKRFTFHPKSHRVTILLTTQAMHTQETLLLNPGAPTPFSKNTYQNLEYEMHLRILHQ